jgi:hypothetical protein
MATVLKKNHSLRGKSILPLLSKLRAHEGGPPRQLARTAREIRTEDLTQVQTIDSIRTITGEQANALLEAADMRQTLENLHILLHYVIVVANAEGAPPVPNNQVEEAGPARPEAPQMEEKRPHDENVESLAKRMKQMEEDRATENFQRAKTQVRILAAGNAPREQLTAAIEEVIQAGVVAGNADEVSLYRELRYQAMDPTGPSLHNICLNLFATPHSDRLMAAVKKAAKLEPKNVVPEGNEERKTQQKTGPMESVLPLPPGGAAGNYFMPFMPQYPQWAGQPMGATQYGYSFATAPFRAGPRGAPRGPSPASRKRSFECNFCGDIGHFMRDCEKMKKLKEKL